MKKSFFLLFALAASLLVVGQNRTGSQNLDFEYWTDSTGAFGYQAEGFFVVNMLFQQRDTVQPKNGQFSLNLNTAQLNSSVAQSSARSDEPYTGRPTLLTGWTRYEISGNDTAYVVVHLTKLGRTVGQGLHTFRAGDSQNWLPVEVPVTYSSNEIPDTLTLLFYLEPVVDTSGGAGFYIPSQIGFDDFSLGATGMETHPNASCSIYPNPATDKVHLHGMIGTVELQVYNTKGELVKQLRTNEQWFSVADLPNGLYLLKMRDSDQSFTTPLMKTGRLR